jgi:hypothetical protein
VLFETGSPLTKTVTIGGQRVWNRGGPVETRAVPLGETCPKLTRPCPRMTSRGFFQPVKDVGVCGGNGSALSHTSQNSADLVSVTHNCPHADSAKCVLLITILGLWWLIFAIERQSRLHVLRPRTAATATKEVTLFFPYISRHCLFGLVMFIRY